MAITLSSAGSDTPAARERGCLDLEHAARGEEGADPRQDPRACAQGLERGSLGVAHRRFTPVAALPSAAPIARDAPS